MKGGRGDVEGGSPSEDQRTDKIEKDKFMYAFKLRSRKNMQVLLYVQVLVRPNQNQT